MTRPLEVQLDFRQKGDHLVSVRRQIDKSTPLLNILTWFKTSKLRIGSHLPVPDRERILRVLYTWKDIFLDDVRQLEETDLVQHSIPTKAGTRPYRAREPLYTPREVGWQLENIPKVPKAGIITYTSSPWSAKSRFVLKHSGNLRPVHQFCALNCRTIKAMGYTPSQLLIRFNPTRQIAWDLSPTTDARLDKLESHIQAIVRGDPVLPLGDPEPCVESLDGIR